MLSLNAKVGIWGLGVVGNSLARYLVKAGCANLLIYDKKITPESLSDLHLPIVVQTLTDLERFLSGCDYIIPSPGIDLTNYRAYKHKFITELDFFFDHWRKPIVGITGTLGKTTLTTQLTELLQKMGLNAVAGGNIEPAMCDLLDGSGQLAVLELSSFQLEHARYFAPDLAIWTNFYPNHLDRHQTMAAYYGAKLKILSYQTAAQKALVPFELLLELPAVEVQLFGFSLQVPASIPINCQGVFYLYDQQIRLRTCANDQLIMELSQLQIGTHQINLVILGAVIYLQGLQSRFNALAPIAINAQIEHRLEKFHTFNQIDFYNDSKSTVAQATLAAVRRLRLNSSVRPVILILGGLGKGVDREALVAELAGQVRLIISFEAEAKQLEQYCQKYQISSLACVDLPSVIRALKDRACSDDQVLFSPAGASFDLFVNYIARGHEFKQQVVNNWPVDIEFGTALGLEESR